MSDVGDPVEPHPTQGRRQVGRQPQGFQRQRRQGGVYPPIRDDVEVRTETGDGIGRAVGRRDRGARADARPVEPVDEIAKQGGLAALKMGGAGDVDRQTVRWIGLADRRVALERPQGETVQSQHVAFRIGVAQVEAGDKGLGLCHGHAHARAASDGGGVAGRDDALATDPTGQDERRLRRRRVGGEATTQPIDGPVRKVKRDDPSHRKRPE